MHRSVRFPVALLALLPLAATAAAPPTDAAVDARARAIHARVLTFDAHTDVLIPSTNPRYFKDGKSRTDVELLTRGGIDAVAFAVAVGPGPRTPQGDAEARAEANEKIVAIRNFAREHADRVEIAGSASDIERIHRAGKIAVVPSFLNARSLGANLDGITSFYNLGVRIFGFTHAGNNAFADSSRPSGTPREEHHGLSDLGKQAVPLLNRLGVVIDVSQLTPAGVSQVLQLTRAPVIASHSGVRALVDNARNLSDAELDLIKANGGVVGVPAFNSYLAPLTPDLTEKVRALRVEFGLSSQFAAGAAGFSEGSDKLAADRLAAFTQRLGALLPKADVSNYVDHIDYIARRIGVEHVGIGTDFNHGAGINGFDDEGEALNVTRELVRRGYSERDIARIWGQNFLRVFREVERVSAALRSRRT